MNAPYTPDYAEIANKIQPVIDNINLKDLDAEKELKKIADQIRKEYNLK
ncbi:hypothetical protein MM522_07885 [Bacillus subtilis]|nr:hypothetical protein [Bacillus subtilis]MEC0261466.1 hypothetical protein [Bacillus subtilis]UNF71617.1 hypothetical protein MM522_07885 [Bacillus subtilis]